MSDNLEAEGTNLVNRIFQNLNKAILDIGLTEMVELNSANAQPENSTVMFLKAEAVYLGRKEFRTLLYSIHRHSCLTNKSTFLCRKFEIFGLPIVEVNQESYFRVV